MGENPLSALRHRGPDSQAIKTFKVGPKIVELGQSRLAIIDLDVRSSQPMFSTDERYVLVFNGEIYNYLELKAKLEKQGRHFRTTSDSEVLLQSWITWGAKSLDEFEGMFAFIILDRRERKLFLARDPFGIKPLYLAYTREGLAFSSEIRPLLDCPGVSRRGDSASAYQYVVSGQTDTSSATLFHDVKRFPAAHWAVVDIDSTLKIEFQRYWEPKTEVNDWSMTEAAAEIRDEFLRSVALHLRSDVPVGTALSGGIDSSAIVAAVREVGGTGLDLKSFSFISPGDDVDESKWVGIAAQGANAQSFTVTATANEMEDDLEDLIIAQGEPFGSSSIYAQYRVMSLAASAGIKVMLDGQGSDELFAGYRPFLAARIAEQLQKGEIGGALALANRASKLPQSGPGRLALQVAGAFAPEWAKTLGRRILGKSYAPTWVNMAWLDERGITGPNVSTGSRPDLIACLRESLTTSVLPALLRYEDRNSMRFSIEARVPFLTKRMVDLAYACPSSFLVSQMGETKSVLRLAMRGLVDDRILDRRDKVGFATPETKWLSQLGTLYDRELTSDSAQRLPFLNFSSLKDRMRQDNMVRQGDYQAWRWLNLFMWARIYDVTFT